MLELGKTFADPVTCVPPWFFSMQPIWGSAVGQVVMSANPEFESGDTVLGNVEFSEYVIVTKGKGLEKVDSSQAPLSYYLGVLGNREPD